jgi:hypothetical protein
MFPSRCTGLDGKTYPRRPLPAAGRAFLIGRAHYLAHDEQLSTRQIVARLTEENNVRRSVGSVHSWLAQPCEACPVQVRDVRHLNTEAAS